MIATTSGRTSTRLVRPAFRRRGYRRRRGRAAGDEDYRRSLTGAEQAAMAGARRPGRAGAGRGHPSRLRPPRPYFGFAAGLDTDDAGRGPAGGDASGGRGDFLAQ